MNEFRIFKRMYVAAMLAVAFMLAFSGTARATVPTISVDGTTYDSYQSSGPVDHYLTPSTGVTAQSVVFTARHTWDGVHGAENLPCEGGYLHWVDNSQLLTISDCREGGTPSPTPTPTVTPSPSTPPTTPPPTTSTPPPTSSTHTPTPPTTHTHTPPPASPDGSKSPREHTTAYTGVPTAAKWGTLAFVVLLFIGSWAMRMSKRSV